MGEIYEKIGVKLVNEVVFAQPANMRICDIRILEGSINDGRKERTECNALIEGSSITFVKCI